MHKHAYKNLETQKPRKYPDDDKYTKSPDLTTFIIFIFYCYFEPHCLQHEVWVNNNYYSTLISLHRVP